VQAGDPEIVPRRVLHHQTDCESLSHTGPVTVAAALGVYRAEHWHDFFMTVGTSAAGLTGLVFVAMSINATAIARDATHRYRAISTLTGTAAAFIVSSFALMGSQGHEAVGIEWFVVTAIAAVVYISGYSRAVRQGGSAVWLRLRRIIIGSICYAVELVGAALLIVGHLAGLYIAASALLVQLVLMISGAWLLVIAVSGPVDAPGPRN
jgi:hypothetical protein